MPSLILQRVDYQIVTRRIMDRLSNNVVKVLPSQGGRVRLRLIITKVNFYRTEKTRYPPLRFYKILIRNDQHIGLFHNMRIYFPSSSRDSRTMEIQFSLSLLSHTHTGSPKTQILN
jgi:hypothetical protein